MFIPARCGTAGHPPLEELEDDLHTGVAYVILPLFASTHAGIGGYLPLRRVLPA